MLETVSTSHTIIIFSTSFQTLFLFPYFMQTQALYSLHLQHLLHILHSKQNPFFHQTSLQQWRHLSPLTKNRQRNHKDLRKLIFFLQFIRFLDCKLWVINSMFLNFLQKNKGELTSHMYWLLFLLLVKYMLCLDLYQT